MRTAKNSIARVPVLLQEYGICAKSLDACVDELLLTALESEQSASDIPLKLVESAFDKAG